MKKCLDAVKNLNISKQNNAIHISPCCLTKTKPVQFVDFKNDLYLNHIRAEWKDQQFPSECNACERSESAGLISRRQGSNQWYKDNDYDNDQVELIRLDYWTGDTCNLQCIICGPHNSSAWKQELQMPNHIKKSVVNKFWDDLDLTNLKFIHFNGGEPLLSKEHIKFLQAIPDKKAVHLNYNTNGTIRPDKDLLDLWEKFRLVQIDFSIDDIGPRFEYQRYPAKWNSLVENLNWFIENCPHNCMMSSNTSVGVLNHDNLQNLNNWLSKNFSKTKYNDLIQHRQQEVFGLFSLIDAPKRLEKILIFLENCDSRRGTNWKNVFPNLLDYLATDK